MNNIFDGWSKHTIVTLVNARGKGGANFSRVHEYLLAYVAPSGIVAPLPKNLDEPLFEDLESPDENLEQDTNSNTFLAPLRRWGQGSRRKDRASMFFPIYVSKESLEIVDVGTPMPLEVEPEPFDKDGVVAIYPIDKKGIQRRWRYGYEGVLDEIDAKNLVVVFDGNKYEIKRKETPTDYISWKTLWTKEEFAGSSGARFLKYIFGRDDAFPYPKSVYAVAEAIFAATHNRPNALILDFFAGSGTTHQSVSYLNAVYGGNRRCVLVTNNEVNEKTAKQLYKDGFVEGNPEFEKHGIAESVTFPRCKYVTNGKRDDGTLLPGKYLNGRDLAKGFDENLAYFKLGFLDPNQVALKTQFQSVLPILWLMAGAKGKLELTDHRRPFYIPEKSPFAVLLKESHFAEFNQAIADREDLTHVFLVTDSEEAFREMSEQVKGECETVMLYKNYLDNFRLNTERDV